MLKRKNGVTLVVLIITIIVMLIILGITITTTTELLRETDMRRFETSLHLIEARAQTLLNDYLFDGTDNLGATLNTNINMFDWEEDSSKYIYREWDIEELKKQGIDTTNILEDEIFVIQYDIINEEIDVGSTIGIVDSDGDPIYTLSVLEELE